MEEKGLGPVDTIEEGSFVLRYKFVVVLPPHIESFQTLPGEIVGGWSRVGTLRKESLEG